MTTVHPTYRVPGNRRGHVGLTERSGCPRYLEGCECELRSTIGSWRSASASLLSPFGGPQRVGRLMSCAFCLGSRDGGGSADKQNRQETVRADGVVDGFHCDLQCGFGIEVRSLGLYDLVCMSYWCVISLYIAHRIWRFNRNAFFLSICRSGEFAWKTLWTNC